MRRMGILVLAAICLCIAACGSGGDEAEAIHGTWLWRIGVIEVSETYHPDGTWDAYDAYDHDWGTYTLEDGILAVTNADDSYCGPNSGVVFEVTFSEDGNELYEEVVSESCGKPSIRGQDRVLTRQTP